MKVRQCTEALKCHIGSMMKSKNKDLEPAQKKFTEAIATRINQHTPSILYKSKEMLFLT